jgi:hypothetical protein
MHFLLEPYGKTCGNIYYRLKYPYHLSHTLNNTCKDLFLPNVKKTSTRNTHLIMVYCNGAMMQWTQSQQQPAARSQQPAAVLLIVAIAVAPAVTVAQADELKE